MKWLRRRRPDPPRAPKVVNPYLLDAVQGVATHDTPLRRQVLYTELGKGGLLVATREKPEASAVSVEGSWVTFKEETAMSIGTTLVGGKAVPQAFTDSDTFRAGADPSAHCQAFLALDFFAIILQQSDAPEMMLNPGGPHPMALSRAEMELILEQSQVEEPARGVELPLVWLSKELRVMAESSLSINRPARAPTREWTESLRAVLARHACVSAGYLSELTSDQGEKELVLAMVVPGGIDIPSHPEIGVLIDDLRARCQTVGGPEKPLRVLGLLDSCYGAKGRAMTTDGVLVYQRGGAPREAVDRLLLRRKSALQARSDWERFGIPVEAIHFLSEEQVNGPPRPLDTGGMPEGARARIEAMDSLIRKSGPLPEPVTVFSGLNLSSSVAPPGVDPLTIARLFAPERAIELRGFLVVPCRPVGLDHPPPVPRAGATLSSRSGHSQESIGRAAWIRLNSLRCAGNPVRGFA